MARIFISSVQYGFEDIRDAARRGVESAGHQAAMAETTGAAAASPRQVLFDRIRSSDALLLIIGPRYGTPQESGKSATEEEYEEAVRRGKDILVLRQAGAELEPEQQELLRRAGGRWEEGNLYDEFQDASDVGFAVVRALTNLQARGDRARLEPVAQARAEELAVGAGRGGFAGAAPARIVFVPLLGQPLLRAVELGDPSLAEELAAAARAAQLVPQTHGINARVSRAGVTLEIGAGPGGQPRTISIGVAGEVVAEVGVTGSDSFGSSRVIPERVRGGLEAAASFALAAWQRIDPRGAVREAAVTVAIDDAPHRVWGPDRGGSSIRMGGLFGSSGPAIAPRPPLVVRRTELSRSETIEAIVAELRQVFADAGALDEA